MFVAHINITTNVCPFKFIYCHLKHTFSFIWRMFAYLRIHNYVWWRNVYF